MRIIILRMVKNDKYKKGEKVRYTNGENREKDKYTKEIKVRILIVKNEKEIKMKCKKR